MARPRQAPKIQILGVARRKRAALMVSTALQATVVVVLSLPAHAQPAPNAHPTGGTVVGGAAAISQNAAGTTINQATARAAINWQSFNVGSQQTVTFNQPSRTAMALNNVVGPNPSQIAGKINANGQIMLVNQSGVVFYKGSQVNAAGLMVSAAGITTENFMHGVMKFDQPAHPHARVENQGTITIRDEGLAALVAPQVANSGVITARLGHVVLAGAKTATLDMYGDGLLSVNVTGQVTQAPDGSTALVTNTGVIRADGGTVQLTAKAVDGVVQNLVSAGGTISARSIGGKTGAIAINGVGGSIVVEGQLDASGSTPDSMGGHIGLLASDTVTVKSGAKINASGPAGGGIVAIGTTLKRAAGGPSVTSARTAQKVVIESGATIAADATVKGHGGRV
ncbi:MAG TPA: filamentous hemagglutinin N-terminal domain-containing protein, partial [Acetobacteraceae bacterium]